MNKKLFKSSCLWGIIAVAILFIFLITTNRIAFLWLNGILPILIIFAVFAVPTALVYFLKISYIKGADVYSMQALPQYKQFLSEYEQKNGEAGEEIEAKLYAKALQYITLKAPKSSVFCDLNEMCICKTEKGYKVSGYVDSQNSYGAMIRSNFSLTVLKDNGAWKTSTNLGAQIGGKFASKMMMYWVIGILITLVSTALIYFIMFG